MTATEFAYGVTRDGAGTPFTAAIVREALGGRVRLHEAREFGVTGSVVGDCRRRAAYLDAGVEATEPDMGHPAADIGDAIHLILLPRLAEMYEGGDVRIEQRSWWTPWEAAAPVRVRYDIAILDEEYLGDVKTMGEYKWEKFLQHGPTRRQIYQLLVGAAGLVQDGHSIKRIQIIAIRRSNGDVATWEDDYREDDLQPIVEYMREVRAYAKVNPDEAPRDERGPGLSFECNNCIFLTRCWGPGATAGKPGPQRIVDDAPAMADALRRYREAGERVRAAEADKAHARAEIDRADKATYRTEDGEMYSLAWKKGHVREPTLDADQTVSYIETLEALLAANQIEAPESPRLWRPPVRVGPSPIVKVVTPDQAT